MSQVDNSKRINKDESTPTGYPALVLHEENILITVKTYPHPSVSYKEIVCTAGITESGKWIRLYPIDYRYIDYESQFSKYQWIKVKIEKNPKDFRIDSYRPNINSIKKIGMPLDTKKGWEKRKKIVMPTVRYKSLEEIEDYYNSNKISLGIFKPKAIHDLKIEGVSSNWSKKHTNILTQGVLFGKQPKPLIKVPYKFSYIFSCNDVRCKKPHKLAIFDWEISMLYLNIKNNYPYANDEILQKVKDRWLKDMWDPKRDSYLIVGTTLPMPTFIVLGVFWPEK